MTLKENNTQITLLMKLFVQFYHLPVLWPPWWQAHHFWAGGGGPGHPQEDGGHRNRQQRQARHQNSLPKCQCLRRPVQGGGRPGNKSLCLIRRFFFFFFFLANVTMGPIMVHSLMLTTFVFSIRSDCCFTKMLTTAFFNLDFLNWIQMQFILSH